VTTTAGRHRAWLDIDHGALAANVATLRGLAAPGTELIAVVKANAYGHGAVEVSETLTALGAERLAVATVSEAAELRSAGQDGPLLVLWGIGTEDAPAVAGLGLEPMVDNAAVVGALAAAAAQDGRRIGVHLKVDTGLGRQGIEPGEAVALARQIAGSSDLALAGTMTHLAAPDDASLTALQLERMASVLDDLRASGIDPGLVHVAGTGAVLAGVGAFADAIRPGIGLYGLAPVGHTIAGIDLRPVLTLRALPLRVFEVDPGTPIGYGMRWTAARQSRLATLPIGYGDGWPRSHLNNGWALVRGQRVPMVGAISMDGLVVDISDAGSVGLDDEFVLIGRQGDESITADEVAAQRQTINYEVTTMLRGRLPRRHHRP
jgi:alanine racemase